jgi:hypothetical protein
MIPTSVLNINLKIRPVIVIGIIQGIRRSPLTGFENLKFLLKNTASANPIMN